MATPVTLKKLDEKKQAAEKRREKTQKEDHLLPLNGMGPETPYSHLLISGTQNPAPRMMDLRPLTNQFTQYRQRKEDFSADRPSGRNYTSFVSNEITHRNGNTKKQRGDGGASALEKQLSQLAIVDTPAELPAFEYILKSNNLVCFHGKGHFLSTLYPVKINVDGHDYPSVEHYYQACKIFSLVGPDQAQLLRNVLDTLKVKQKAKDILRNYRVNNQKVEHWKNTTGLLVLLHGIRFKFTQNQEMRDKLLATGDALLCQAYDRDAFYAVGMTEEKLREWARENEGKILKFPSDLDEDKVKYIPLVGKGKNVLGVLCMQIRHLIKYGVGPVIDKKKTATAQVKDNGAEDKSTISSLDDDDDDLKSSDDDFKS
uniref:NADAR domain-containing protein n=2 Tax=Meloidogyne incognita TaxID=6306 RepID=A0A914N2H3_MELIC